MTTLFVVVEVALAKPLPAFPMATLFSTRLKLPDVLNPWPTVEFWQLLSVITQASAKTIPYLHANARLCSTKHADPTLSPSSPRHALIRQFFTTQSEPATMPA